MFEQRFGQQQPAERGYRVGRPAARCALERPVGVLQQRYDAREISQPEARARFVVGGFEQQPGIRKIARESREGFRRREVIAARVVRLADAVVVLVGQRARLGQIRVEQRDGRSLAAQRDGRPGPQ